MNTDTTLKLELPIADVRLDDLAVQAQPLLDRVLKQYVPINDYVLSRLENTDGAPELIDLRVTSFQYNPATKKGRFRLNFQISRRFCCSDVSRCAGDYMEFTFTYDNDVLYAEAHYFQWSLDN